MAVFGGLFLSPIASTIRLALDSDDYTHILLVAPVAFGLLFLEGSRSKAASGNSYALGTLLLALGLIIAWSAHSVALAEFRLSASMAGLILCWQGVTVAVLGTKLSRELLFPLLFLFFLIPFPRTVVDSIIFGLQSASAEASFFLFKLAGVPALKNGFVISTSSLDIEVATECSGIRSSEMLLLTCLVLGHLYLKSFSRQLLFAVVVIPIAIAKNALRIFTISMLGVHVDPGFLHGSLHRKGGIVFFTMGLGLLMGLLWLLHRSENQETGHVLLAPHAAAT
jgi:exosortase